MTSSSLRFIRILTLIEAALGIHAFFRVYESGLWISFEDFEGAFFVLVQVAYRSIIMPTGALVIGLSTLKDKHWSWRANTVLQIASITVVSFIVMPLLVAAPEILLLKNLTFGSTILFELVLASLILYLLLRTKPAHVTSANQNL